jgi:hypothetical protein
MDRKALVATNSTPSDLNPSRKLKVSSVLIESWTYWIASEVITSFQSKKTVSINVENAIQVLELDKDRGFSKLANELIHKKLELENELTTHEQLDLIKETWEVYYFDVVAPEVVNLSRDTQLQSTNILKNLIDTQFEQASPESLMSFLEQITQKLVSKRGELEVQKGWNSAREKSAWSAFYKLHQHKGSLNDSKSILNAIKIGLESKLEIDKYDCINFVTFELIKVCQSYYGHVEQSFICLEQIKNSLKDKNSLNIVVSLPVFSLLNKVNIDEQEKLLEVWIGGHKLNYWGNSPASWQQIEGKLLSNLEPVLLSIVAELEAYYIEHLTT